MTGLAHRVIPTLLCRGRQLVKGSKFQSWRSVGLVEQAVRVHQARGVDELILLDISATIEDRHPDLNLVRELSDNCFMPLTVGGGVKSVDDVQALLANGADKVVIGTALIEDPTLLPRCADRFGCQAIVASVDVYKGDVVSRCGKTLTRINAYAWPLVCELHGAGEIMVTDCEREGTMVGYDIPYIKEISKSLKIPLIAHGGCGNFEHMQQAIEAGADAVAAGAFFQFTDATPIEASRYLQNHGIEART